MTPRFLLISGYSPDEALVYSVRSMIAQLSVSMHLICEICY